ncbi:PEP/pyruvate-binding domain-containing protein [Rubritalea profundi]|uniref:Phosphoenolpyruvate synthase n=1 Tax=Rubritalea profundi TaxID=1658618 RepID=A0A2S7TYG3_9BACT|nr:PEP/pyruvate-binding domain-containing protein [Rubritalea profundi]PQJ27102.1 hypothetical protein BSZ32_00350 [Rubritalea profundi]
MILHSQDLEHADKLGGKAKALAQLGQADFNIPFWFVVADFTESDCEEILNRSSALGSDLFAVRSSAAAEDGAQHSFAGQFDSYLNVPRSQLIEKIKRVQQSSKSAHIESYQSSQSIENVTPPSVLIQCMLEPDVSGVAFSADPVAGNLDHTVISSVWGTGSALVSGEVDADCWTLDADSSTVKEVIAHKKFQHSPCPTSLEGVQMVETAPEKIEVPSLTKTQRREVQQLVRHCAEHFDSPQDIEWAYQDGSLYLLQSRPITTLKHGYRNSDPLTVWDNSNIAESYSGHTSIMTFSFAERAYENVYREFCRMLSVPEKRVIASDPVFKNMLGHIHGHVYYNLNSWYHVLALLPGFSLNRSFMEQMMGVKEPMPDEIVETIIEKTRVSKMADGCALVGTFFGLIKNHRGLKKQMDGFYQRLNQALSLQASELENMDGKQLAQHYRDLEDQLLQRWDAPLINDFFAMIHYGTLRSLCEKWLGDGSLQNTLLLDTGDIISAEPPTRIKEMASIAAKDASLSASLADPDLSCEVKLAHLMQNAELAEAYQSYLEKFGDRCLEELKLESPTVVDDPVSLLSGIGGMAQRIRNGKVPQNPQPFQTPEIQLSGIKSVIFKWVLNNAKSRVRDRENLRFERTRLFGRVRKIVVLLAQQLVDAGWIDDPQEVFLLTISEVIGVYESTQDPAALRALIIERKAQAASFTTPPDRFETRGEVTQHTPLIAAQSAVSSDSSDLSGTGACPGIVRGFVRVVHDPRSATLKEGEILVAQQTDPGWVVLFPAASGLLVERGSLLSHSAIVARELQLPCIVSIPAVTRTLKTGDYVEMNGSTGTIQLIDHVI